MDSSTTTQFWLGDCQVDATMDRIIRGQHCVQLEPRQMRVLLLLTRHPEQTLSQRQIEKAVWGDALVSLDALYRCIAQLRLALGDQAKQPKFIQTVPRRGYRLIAPLRYETVTPEPSQPEQVDEPAQEQDVGEAALAPSLNTAVSILPPAQPSGWLIFASSCGCAVLFLAIGMFWVVNERNHAARETANATQIAQFMENVFSSSDARALQGKPETAQELLDKAMQRLDVDLKQQPLVRMRMLETMARSYAHQHQDGRALPAIEEALRIRRGLSSKPQPEVALTLAELGEALRDMNRFEEAKHAYQESLDIFRITQPQPSRDFALTFSQLGNLERDQGHFPEALKILNESLQQVRTIQGLHHSDSAEILVTIGSTCRCMSELNRAERALREAQGIYRLATPELDPNRLAADNAAGEVLLLQHRFDEATIVLERTLAARQQLFGSKGIPISETLSLLASARNEQGRSHEAEELRSAALFALDGLGEAANLQRATIHLSFATQLMRTGQFDRSEQLLREAIDLYAATLPADHISRTSAEHYLGETLLEQKKYGEAATVLLTAIERMQRAAAPQWRIARSMNTLGEVLYRQGQTETASKLLLASYSQLASDPDAKPSATAKAKQRIQTLLGKASPWASVLSQR